MCVDTDFRIVVVPLVRATCYRTHCPISRIIIPRYPFYSSIINYYHCAERNPH